MEESKYKKILDAMITVMAEGVHIVDSKGVGMFYNKAMSHIEQVRIEDIIGKDYKSSFPDMNIEESTIYHALHYNQVMRDRPQHYINASGKEINTINTTIPVIEDGQTIAAIEVASDITQLTTLSNKILPLQETTIASGTGKKSTIQKYRFSDLIGESPAFMQSVERARKAAKSDVPVFLCGETGTGKELFAQSIHYGGKRGAQPFLAQNCAALPSNLLENILFGTSKGGFTGAVDRAGLFEQASGGTLLLDELNSMPFELQSKLLRVLQECYIRRVGGFHDIPIDVRIIATVNEDPLELIDRGLLRRDLYYRLSAVTIEIPPLRERKADIPDLVDGLITKHRALLKKDIAHCSPEALAVLTQYDYPGNVRELENIIVQALFMAEDEKTLTPDRLNMPKRRGRQTGQVYQPGECLGDFMARMERKIIQDSFDRYNGNVTQCALALGIKRQTLQHKLRNYGIGM